MNAALAIPHDVTLADGGFVAAAAWKRGFTPPPILTLSQWADEHRVLPQEGAKEYGKWRTSRTPYLRQIMDDLSVHSPYTEVSFLKSTQVGGTEVCINLLSYVIEHAPGPLMYVLPTLDIARKFSSQRLQPAFDLMASVRRKLGAQRRRDGGNSTLTKKFMAGFMVLSGANSANSLASMPVRYLILDESGKYPLDLDDQGTAQEQAERRTSSYTRRKKIARVSSPTIEDACPISADYERGHQACYHVPCPYCQQLQELVPEQLTDDGQFLCIHCGELIDESHKAWMLRERGHSEDGLAEWIAKHPERQARSYRLWAAYAAPGLGYTWVEIAQMRRDVKDHPEKEVAFVNTILGRAYQGASEQAVAKEIAERAGGWKRRMLPPGCLILTGFVDVQANRFSCGVWGWGSGDRCWAIDWVELPGDPTRKQDWQQVEDYFAQPIINSFGVPVTVRLIGVDSGNWKNDVYNFVRPRQGKGFVATKGMSKQDAPVISRPAKDDGNTRGQADRKGIRRYNLGVHAIKTTLMRRLIKDGELAVEQRRFNFPADHDEVFYEQLTAERLDLTINRWICPKSKRNEVLDILVGAYAMACSPTVRLHVMRDADWMALEARVEPGTADLWSVAATAPPPAAVEATEAPTPVAAAPQPSPPRAPATPARNPFASSDWTSRR